MNVPKRAHNKFNKLYQEYKSPRALFGLAVTLNKLALASNDSNEAAKLQGLYGQSTFPSNTNSSI